MLILALAFSGCEDEPRPKVGHIYDTVYGSVYCGTIHRWSAAAVELTDCHDGARYLNMYNVRERE